MYFEYPQVYGHLPKHRPKILRPHVLRNATVDFQQKQLNKTSSVPKLSHSALLERKYLNTKFEASLKYKSQNFPDILKKAEEMAKKYNSARLD